MKLDRRNFLKWSAAQATFLGVASSSSASLQIKNQPRTTPSVMQGATDDTQTQFSILYHSNITLEIFATNSAGEIWNPEQQFEITHPGHPQKLTKVAFHNLHPNESFFLKIIDANSKLILDSREFKTLNLSKSDLSFAVCSCLKDENHEPEIWLEMFERKPDLIFLVGDTVYADSGVASGQPAPPAHLWKRFCEARSILEIYFQEKLIPVLATWDDHDFGVNNAGYQKNPHLEFSQQNFLNFFAQDEKHCRFLKNGPGVASAFQFNSQLFILLDSRSFREDGPSEERYAHWGPRQEKWALDLIKHHNGPAWIMNGTQVFPNFIFLESVARDHKAQLKGLTDELKQLPARAIFVSGDVHFSEITQIEASHLGYPTYEITSSAVHSRPFPGAPGLVLNPQRIASTGQRNYTLIKSTAQNFGARFQVLCISKDGQVEYQEELAV